MAIDFLPEIPELVGIRRQTLVFQCVCISTGISEPNIKTTISQHETEALIWKICDPLTGRSQKAMLEENCRPLGTSLVVVSTAWDSLNGEDITVRCCDVIFFHRIPPVSNDLRLCEKLKKAFILKHPTALFGL